MYMYLVHTSNNQGMYLGHKNKLVCTQGILCVSILVLRTSWHTTLGRYAFVSREQPAVYLGYVVCINCTLQEAIPVHVTWNEQGMLFFAPSKNGQTI